MKAVWIQLVASLVAVAVAGTAALLHETSPARARTSVTQQTPPRLLAGDAHTHDPSLVRDGRLWYVFSTGDPKVGGGTIQVRSSRDARHWTYGGTVGTAIPSWVRDAVPGVSNLWGPDISYHDGRWYLYYAASTFGSNRSVIGLFTNVTLNPADPRYHWTDRGKVAESTKSDDFNAIDPTLFVGARAWLAFGSFWSGIKLIQVQLPSGKPTSPHPRRWSLVDRHFGPNAVEAPTLVAHGGWYYLFVSFDSCCQGVNSTYHVVVGRSRSVTGPYLDRYGTSLLAGGGSAVLDSEGDMRGPGGESVAGRVFAFHYYDAARGGDFHLGLADLTYRHGWPVLTDLRI